MVALRRRIITTLRLTILSNTINRRTIIIHHMAIGSERGIETGIGIGNEAAETAGADVETVAMQDITAAEAVVEAIVVIGVTALIVVIEVTGVTAVTTTTRAQVG